MDPDSVLTSCTRRILHVVLDLLVGDGEAPLGGAPTCRAGADDPPETAGPAADPDREEDKILPVTQTAYQSRRSTLNNVIWIRCTIQCLVSGLEIRDHVS